MHCASDREDYKDVCVLHTWTKALYPSLLGCIEVTSTKSLYGESIEHLGVATTSCGSSRHWAENIANSTAKVGLDFVSILLAFFLLSLQNYCKGGTVHLDFRQANMTCGWLLKGHDSIKDLSASAGIGRRA